MAAVAMVSVKHTTLRSSVRYWRASLAWSGNRHVQLFRAPLGARKVSIIVLTLSGKQIACIEVPLRISGEELRLFLKELISLDYDFVYEASPLEDSRIISFEAQTEVQIYAIRANPPHFRYIHDILHSLHDRRIRFHDLFWSDWPFERCRERTELEEYAGDFSKQEYWDALWLQQEGFSRDQLNHLEDHLKKKKMRTLRREDLMSRTGCAWLDALLNQAWQPESPKSAPSPVADWHLKRRLGKVHKGAWNDGRRGNRVTASGKRQ